MKKKSLDEMSEQERAIYYEEHKDDPSLWRGTPRRIRPRRGGPSTVFSVRMTPQELEEIAAAADSEETSVGDFIRRSALERARSVRSS